MTSIETNTAAGSHLTHRTGVLLPIIFTLTIFVSASLLFFVQPLFAKLVLPHIGGAPAVWTTAMLFFQTVLLAGYIYAHILSHYVPLRWQLPIHLCFWSIALMFLPLSISADWVYDPQASTTWQTLSLFALGVGVPFGMLSANAPLLQSWYAKSSGPSAQDPYFLYGSSNVGSLLALMAFPLVAEPLLGARAIGTGWAVLFVIFGAGLAASGLLAQRHPATPTKDAKASHTSAPVTFRQITVWIFLAFVPSSLMLAITTKVSTDMGSLPLIWAIPLSLYILSFVVTFTNRPWVSDRVLPQLAAGACVVLAVLMSSFAKGLPTWGNALLFAPALFVVSVHAHRTLYQNRPDSAHLTLFYICMSVGGAFGGLFNSILAPSLFDSLHEGWLSVCAVSAVALVGKRGAHLRSLAYALILVGLALFGFGVLRDAGGVITLLAAMMVFAILCSCLWRAPLAIFAAISVFLVTDMLSVREAYLFKDRSFFGAHTVYDKDGLRVYANGTTVHGYQAITSLDERPTPLSYYHPSSPMAQVLTESEGIETARIGVVGLGVGSLACYAQPDQSWEFYEIDEMVDRVARTPSLFSFMSSCAPGSQTHLGDARIVLAQQDMTFDVMVLDAYSSDSIPVHLVTVEAVEMYLTRLAADGQLVFHISNRYYDLTQPLARIGRELGLHAVIRHDTPEKITTPGAQPSLVLVMSPDEGRARTLLKDARWRAVVADDKPAWTDDRANVLSALK